MSLLADQILDHARRTGEVRYGYIESIGGGLASVRMAGMVVEGATWVSRYMPVVGDRVAVIAGDAGWLVLGATSPQSQAWNEPESVFIIPEHGIVNYARRIASDSWDDDLTTPGNDPKLPAPIDETWGLRASADHPPGASGSRAYAGRGPAFGGVDSGDPRNGAIVPLPSDKAGYVPEEQESAVLVWHMSLSPPEWGWENIWDDIPANAQVLDVAYILRLREFPAGEPAPPWLGPVSFQVYPLHTLRMNRTWMLDPTDMPPPDYFIAHEANLPPIQIESAYPGDLIVLPISPEWEAAEYAGIVGGFVVMANEERLVHFANRYDLVPDGDGGLRRQYRTEDCFTMRVRYTTPIEED